MKKQFLVPIIFFSIIILSFSLISANIFSDFFGKSTGKVTTLDQTCIPDGQLDDTLGKTTCCSGTVVGGSTLCGSSSDWFTTWESCTQICGTGSICPYGPTGTQWCPCPSGTTNNGNYGVGVCQSQGTTTPSTPTCTIGNSSSKEIAEGATGEILGVSIKVISADETNLKLSATILVIANQEFFELTTDNPTTFPISINGQTYTITLLSTTDNSAIIQIKCGGSSTAPTCIDSDGGRNYGKLGVVKGYDIGSQRADTLTDFCDSDTGNLWEYWCGTDQGNRWNYAWEQHSCPNGCSDGACLTAGTNRTNNRTQQFLQGVSKEDCSSCYTGNKCYPFGYRTNSQFCSGNSEFNTQFQGGAICNNNFECDSNACISGQCISQSLLQKFLKWVQGIFG